MDASESTKIIKESLALSTVILAFVLWLAMREKLIPFLDLARASQATHSPRVEMTK